MHEKYENKLLKIIPSNNGIIDDIFKFEEEFDGIFKFIFVIHHLSGSGS